MCDHFALPHHRNVVGDRHDLPELVGDEDHRLPLLTEFGEDAEEVVRLLRGQHPGGFVEDEDVRAPVERLEDFHTLLQAHWQVLDERIGVHLQPILLLQPQQLLTRLFQGAVKLESGLDAEDHVFQHGEGVHEHEVLMHHPDPGFDGVVGAVDLQRLALHPNLPGVSLVEAVEDAHQRGLARAVLPDDAVDRPGLHRQVDVAVGLHGTKVLADADEFNGGGYSGFQISDYGTSCQVMCSRKNSGAKSAPLLQYRVCPSKLNDWKNDLSFNGSKSSPYNSEDKLISPSAPSLNASHTR